MIQKLKFRNDQMEFYKELRTDVKEYFEKNGIGKDGGIKIIIKTVVMSIIYFLPFILMLSGYITSPLFVILSWIVMGLGMTGIGVATMHDSNHGAFSKHHWVNKLFGNSLYFLGGFPENWKYKHNVLHHGYTNVEGHDEDIAFEGFLRFSPHKPLMKIHKYQHLYAWFFYGFMTLTWVSYEDIRRVIQYKKEGTVLDKKVNYNALFRKLIFTKILYFAFFLILPMVIVPVAWYWTLIGFILMHYTGGFILTVIFQLAHVVPTSSYPLPDDNQNMENNWAIHQLLTTADFSPNSKWFSWLVGGLNFQVVHHLFPNISHIHYKEIADILKKKAEKYNLPYNVNPTFFKAINQHMLMLKKLGRE